MTPQERDVIGGIFDRLKSAQDQQRDPIAEKFIADRMVQQPYAAYAMAQSIFVQETALQNLSAQVEQLQAQVMHMQQAQAQQQAAPAPASGGFFGKLFDQGSAQRAAPQPQTPAAFGRPSVPAAGAWGQPAGQQAPAPGPWGGQPQQAQAPAAGGGFMKSALTTAAGVAGGMVVGSMLMNAFNGGGAGAQTAKAGTEAGTASSGEEQTVALPAAEQGPAYEPPASYNQANYDDGSSGDSGGGGDDWA